MRSRTTTSAARGGWTASPACWISSISDNRAPPLPGAASSLLPPASEPFGPQYLDVADAEDADMAAEEPLEFCQGSLNLIVAAD